MNSLAAKRGSSIAAFGTGAVGLAAVMAARILGARTIIAVDIKPRRLKLAMQLGATHAINNHLADLTRSISAITGGGVDYVVESTGDAQMHHLAISLLNPRGQVALLTGGSGPDHLPGGRKVLSVIQGDAVPQKFIPMLIRLYQQGVFPFDRLVKYYPFRQINRAIADARRGSTIKPVLRIDNRHRWFMIQDLWFLSEAASPATNDLTQKFGARGTLLHVIERNAPKIVDGERHLVQPQCATGLPWHPSAFTPCAHAEIRTAK
jgi:aryl-alcohol dehydrogenase